MGNPSTGTGYGYATYGMSPELVKKFIVQESNPAALEAVGLENAYQNFLNAEPPELRRQRELLQIADDKAQASKKRADFDAANLARQGVNDYGSELILTPGFSITPTLPEKEKQPQKEDAFQELLNKISKNNTVSRVEEPPMRGSRSAFGEYMPQEEEPPMRGSRSAFGEYMPQEEEPLRRGSGNAFGEYMPQEEENVRTTPQTKANEFLEAYKNQAQTEAINNKNEDIAAVYKPSAPTVETWIEKLDKDALRNKDKPIPTGIPYRRGTGLGDHMGADASEQLRGGGLGDAFGEYMLQQEEPTRRGSRNAFGEDMPQEEEPFRRGSWNAFGAYA